jgi:hypothetical protein
MDQLSNQQYRNSKLQHVYDQLEAELASHPYRELGVQSGSNCLTVGGGYSPPYSICEGCMIEEAMQCVDDMRHNVSGNVGQGCDLLSVMVEPQPKCCTKFATPDQGVWIDPATAAYNDALQCLRMVGCRWVDSSCTSSECETYAIYSALEGECLSHTVHEDCRTSCGQWPHDGKLPVDYPASASKPQGESDCDCWKNVWDPSCPGGGCYQYVDRGMMPQYNLDIPKCQKDSTEYPNGDSSLGNFYTRYRGRRDTNDPLPLYDWWQCWYGAHCISDSGTRFYPPIRAGVKIYDEPCNADEQATHDLALADGIIPPWDCPDGGIPLYCSNDQEEVQDLDEESPTFGETVLSIVGINVPFGQGVIKYEDIDCKVDSFACLPTKNSAGKTALGLGLWAFVFATSALLIN